jgi:hypothetical protein
VIEAEPWKLERFGEFLDAWIEQEKPDEDLSYHVVEWVMTRGRDSVSGCTPRDRRP